MINKAGQECSLFTLVNIVVSVIESENKYHDEWFFRTDISRNKGEMSREMQSVKSPGPGLLKSPHKEKSRSHGKSINNAGLSRMFYFFELRHC